MDSLNNLFPPKIKIKNSLNNFKSKCNRSFFEKLLSTTELIEKTKHYVPAQSVSKTELQLKKIMVWILWDYKGVFVFWDAAKQPNDQLRCLPPTTYEIGGSNQREKSTIVFHRDKVRPSLATCTKLLGKWWHPTSDYHLFLRLQKRFKR